MSGARILAIDHGRRRIGTAISDASGSFAFPDKVFTEEEELLWYVRSLAGDLCRVVVGLPLNMDGSVGPRAEEVLRFCERLKEACAVEVVTWDERLSTVEAEELLEEVPPAKRREVLDAVAAQRILASYLRRKKG